MGPHQDEAEAQLAEESQALTESPPADTLSTEGEVLGVYAQADTATVTDAGAAPGANGANAAASAATNTAVAATGLSAGTWGLIGAAGLGLAAAAGGGSKSTPENTPKANQAPTALALTGALAGVGKNEVAKNTATTTRLKVADIAITDDGLGSNTLSLSGADQDLFEIDGNALYLKAGTALDHEAKTSYAVTVQVQDSTVSNSTALSQNFSLQVTNVAAPSTTAQAFDLWQEAELAGLGDTSKNINALNQHSAEIMQQRDTTSADGSANQADPAKRLTQYINQVTGTDIVSEAEFDAGFTITGKATAGAEATIEFRLDKDRTTGVDGEGAQVLSLGANDVDGDGTTDVTASYDNTTGDWSLAFAAGSAALLQATHNTYGSGVHQLLVDTDGNGSRTGTGATAEASRLFLVASGTAASSDTGLVSQNYSVQDKLTNDVFVYYHGDPDGAGIGLWTALDNGDSASNQGLVTTDQDGNTTFSDDFDYYNTPAANTHAATTPVTPSNTALHWVTDIAAQTWEFHMGTNTDFATWVVANAQAADHTLWGSNSSRQASLAEAVALYAANFGGDGSTRTPNTVGAVQPMSNAGSTNGYAAVEDNRPGEWGNALWSAAPTPSGHARLGLYNGLVFDYRDASKSWTSWPIVCGPLCWPMRWTKPRRRGEVKVRSMCGSCVPA
ncbi:hypothetical protein [Limnohabitans sp.]|uniref:hypothetical protein n=1 Tax=Limnohabitans sp. TaxID=1907725 RepID=UPI0037C04ECD